jgi:hypothetical protein
MIESLFDSEEVALMMRAAPSDHLLHQHAYGRKDAQGRENGRFGKRYSLQNNKQEASASELHTFHGFTSLQQGRKPLSF